MITLQVCTSLVSLALHHFITSQFTRTSAHRLEEALVLLIQTCKPCLTMNWDYNTQRWHLLVFPLCLKCLLGLSRTFEDTIILSSMLVSTLSKYCALHSLHRQTWRTCLPVSGRGAAAACAASWCRAAAACPSACPCSAAAAPRSCRWCWARPGPAPRAAPAHPQLPPGTRAGGPTDEGDLHWNCVNCLHELYFVTGKFAIKTHSFCRN